MRKLHVNRVSAALVAVAAAAAVVGCSSQPQPREARAAGETTDRSTTTSGQQYRDWFSRPGPGRAGTTTATEQYAAWYLRDR
jgi:hypothetical protein